MSSPQPPRHLCNNLSPDALRDARDALVDARAVWSYSEPMWVGPVMERRSWAVIDWPIVTDEIEELIADTSIELDNERLSRRIGADQRGLGAVEYILGDPADEAVGARPTQRPATLPIPHRHHHRHRRRGSPPTRRIGPSTSKKAGRTATRSPAATVPDSMRSSTTRCSSSKRWPTPSSAPRWAKWTATPDLNAIVEGPAGLAVSDLSQHLAGTPHRARRRRRNRRPWPIARR